MRGKNNGYPTDAIYRKSVCVCGGGGDGPDICTTTRVLSKMAKKVKGQLRQEVGLGSPSDDMTFVKHCKDRPQILTTRHSKARVMLFTQRSEEFPIIETLVMTNGAKVQSQRVRVTLLGKSPCKSRRIGSF
jgi:hypothetical protein